MITLHEILNVNIPSSHRDLTSNAMIKLLLVAIWANAYQSLTYIELASILGSGERTVYRGIRRLRDLGFIVPTDRNSAFDGGGTCWIIQEKVIRKSMKTELSFN